MHYTLSDLLEKTGVSKRTVHYYIGRGLLPPALRDEGGFYYNDEHLLRIQYIRRLAGQHISLQAIGLQMQGKDLAALQREMEATTPGIPFDITKNKNAPDIYMKVSPRPGLELHISAAMYERLKNKMDALCAYIQKLSQEE